MNTYQITSAGGGFRITVALSDDRSVLIGGFFSPAEARAWALKHLREPLPLLPTSPGSPSTYPAG